jgi:hypothetical protein
MKKLAIGCGVAALLIAIAGGVGMYWVYSKAKDYVGSFAQMGEVADMDQQVTNKASFAPPDTGELTPDQVARFALLNEQVQATLGAKFEQLKARYDQMEARWKAEGREANPAEAITALKDLAGLIKEVRAAQVTALNAQGMSVAEYRWIRDQAYAAAGLPIAGFNVNAFIEAAKGGDVEALAKGVERQAAEAMEPTGRNKELVKPLEDRLGRWASIAWLGF